MKLCAKITIAAHAIRRPAPCLIIAVAFMFVSPAASAHPDGLLKVGAVGGKWFQGLLRVRWRDRAAVANREDPGMV